MLPRRKFRQDRLRFLRSRNVRQEDWDGNNESHDEDPIASPPRPRSKSIYLLPNAFTTASLFCGFFAIVNAMNHRFEVAAIAIFAALVLDGMDGRIARMTNTQSAFGEQYDSLSDMVSFGVAPALVAYRFNANIGVVDKKFFQGLPSPAAAALIAGFIWLADDNKIPVKDSAIPIVTFFITIYAGLTMVSNARFYSGKALDVRYRVPFWVMVLLILVFVLVSTNPPLTLFGVFVVYALSGYVLWLWERARGPRIGGETTAIHKSD